MYHTFSYTVSILKLLNDEPLHILDFLPELTWNTSSGFRLCVSDYGNWIQGIKYTGIVRKRRNLTDVEDLVSSSIDAHEKHKRCYVSLPIWGILNENENGTWCHESTISDIRPKDHVFLNVTAKYITLSNKVLRITKYLTINIGESLDSLPSLSAEIKIKEHPDDKVVPSLLGEYETYEPEFSTEERNYFQERAARNDLVVDHKSMIFP